MAERIPESLQKKIEERLRYYEDLKIDLFYRHRLRDASLGAELPSAASPVRATTIPEQAPLLKRKVEAALPATPALAPRVEPIYVPSGPSLFEAVDRVQDDTLL